MLNALLTFTKLLGLFGCLIKHLTNFKGKLIKDNSMSRKRRWEMVDNLKNSMLAKLTMVRLGLSKYNAFDFLPALVKNQMFEFPHDLHRRYFNYHRNIFNTTEIRRSWNVDKLLNCKLVYSNETKDDLKSESQIFSENIQHLKKNLVKYWNEILLHIWGIFTV